MRASDIGIVVAGRRHRGHQRCGRPTIARIKDAGIPFFHEGDEGFSRDTSRSAPYNLFANLTDVAADAEDRRGPPRRLPAVGRRGGPAAGPAREDDRGALRRRPHHELDVRRTGLRQREHLRRRRRRVPGRHRAGAAGTVGDAGYLDPAGNPVPETKLEGKGEAMIFHDGRLVRGTWKKNDLDAPLTLSTKAGELTVPAGHTWIELVPAANGDVTFTK